MEQWRAASTAFGGWLTGGTERGRRRRPVAPTARGCLNGIDQCLSDLEEMHLQGRYIGRHRGCQRVVDALTLRVAVPAPEAVRSTRTSYALHAALLDWQATLLDEIIPNRRVYFPDLDLEAEEWALPRLPRVHRRVRLQAAPEGQLAGVA